MINKRDFLIGFFVGATGQYEGLALKSRINILCSKARTTPLTSEEAIEIADFLEYAGNLMERNKP